MRGRSSAALVASVAMALGACAALSWLIAARALDPGHVVWFVGSIGAVVLAVGAGLVGGYVCCGRSWRLLALSPVSLAAATWLALFVLRPISLYFSPGDASSALALLGFRLDDLTRTVAIGGLGCAFWCAGYLLTIGRPRPAQARFGQSPIVSGPRAALVFAVGTALWLALFWRQGGPSALLHSAVSIRANQQASSYGFIGVWLIQGMTLVALAAMLQTRSRLAKWVFWVGTTLSILAAVALQLRGPVTFAALAAIGIYGSLRTIRRRHLAVGAALAAAGILVLGVAQQARFYSYNVSTVQAVRLALRTPVSELFVSDLATYDHFVAMQSLVPGSIDYLDGRTLYEIPEAFVPRSLWPGKPRPLDFRVSAYLYPGSTAGTPISVQGEFYWNAGLMLVAFGSLVLGFALGILGRFGLRTAPAGAGFLLYLAVWPFTHALLTRGLAPMLENIVFAALGVSLALFAQRLQPGELGRRFRWPAGWPHLGVARR